MLNISIPPIASSYWVLPGRLLAGGYPGSLDAAEANLKVVRLLEAGVTAFLDLTEEEELAPYAPALNAQARAMRRRVYHRRLPIRDFDVPTSEQMARILDVIDEALDDGHLVYVHCWGGIGRTGTVVGCYLVRHGMGGSKALQRIERLRKGTPYAARRAPETQAQREMVLGWAEG